MALCRRWLTHRRPHVLSPQTLRPNRVSPDRQERPRRRQTAAIRRRHPRPRRRAGARRHPRAAVALGGALCHSAVVLTAYEKGEATAIATRQLGPALALERLWRETGCKQVISALAAEREFQFDLERAVFLTVLHRLFDPGSDRAAEKWRHGLVIDGLAGLGLHQLYRAMGWLGDELADQSTHHQGSRRGAAVRPAQQ